MRLIPAALLGAFAGILSGLFGIGGGVVIVPILVLGLGMDATRAVGTSLAALLLPVGILAVLRYARAGEVDFPVAITIAVTLALSAPLGVQLALSIGNQWLSRVFGAGLILIGLHFIFGR